MNSAALVRRDLRLAYRRRGELATPVVFFIIVTALFPLALGSEPQLLRRLAPGVIWVAALLASLIGQDSLFKNDYEDGSLEQMLLSPAALEWLTLLRVLTHWLVTGLPLVILSLLMGLLLNYPLDSLDVLAGSLLLGTPVLSFLGAVGAALTVSLRRSGMLLPILVLPLTVPVLIFGAAAAERAMQGEPVAAPLYFLAAMLVLAVTLAPFAIAGGLRVSLES
ncbi:MAG: heme exporter protein CcmB [Gammaproteobacteria bacterium]|nr:heme exporter protein CcmB [Gammaproteobacteria bacterium]MBU6509767.1 heme exporter protein CcmB [Gammaproteobacteria bacterium]MDE1983603.1 heme exporter protein CcmB [Gammaproteobacteria bacterium]MDE2108368.1 heme exporter protein CcmB [Gammaproteobacteria bacterium]